MKTMRTNNIFQVIAIVLLVIATYLFVYLWKVIGDGGMYADANGTSGRIPTSQLLLCILDLILFIGVVITLKLGSANKRKD